MTRVLVLALTLCAVGGVARAQSVITAATPAGDAYAAWQLCLAGAPAHVRCRAREAAYFEALKTSRFVDADDVAMMRAGLRARAAASDPVTTGSIGRR